MRRASSAIFALPPRAYLLIEKIGQRTPESLSFKKKTKKQSTPSGPNSLRSLLRCNAVQHSKVGGWGVVGGQGWLLHVSLFSWQILLPWVDRVETTNKPRCVMFWLNSSMVKQPFFPTSTVEKRWWDFGLASSDEHLVGRFGFYCHRLTCGAETETRRPSLRWIRIRSGLLNLPRIWPKDQYRTFQYNLYQNFNKYVFLLVYLHFELCRISINEYVYKWFTNEE